MENHVYDSYGLSVLLLEQKPKPFSSLITDLEITAPISEQWRPYLLESLLKSTSPIRLSIYEWRRDLCIVLGELISRHPNLNELDLHLSTDCTLENIRILLDGISTTKTLRNLMLDIEILSTDVMQLLSNTLATNNSTKTLTLCHKHAYHNDITLLTNILKHNRSIDSLDLTLQEKTQISSEIFQAFQEAISDNQTLKKMTLFYYNHTSPKEFWFSLGNALKKNRSISALHIKPSVLSIANGTGQALVDGLINNRTVTHIELFSVAATGDRCQIMDLVLDSVKKRNIPTSFSFPAFSAVNSLGPVLTLVKSNLVTALDLDIKVKTDLWRNDLAPNFFAPFFKALEDNQSLTKLSVGSVYLDHSQWVIFCDAVAYSQTLRHLNIDVASIYPSSLASESLLLAISENNSLESLSLSLSSDYISRFCTIIAAKKNIKKLWLDPGDFIYDSLYKDVANLIEQNDTLTDLTVRTLSNMVAARGFEEIKAALEKNKKLVLLDVGHPTQFSPLIQRNRNIQSEMKYNTMILVHNIIRSSFYQFLLPIETWMLILKDLPFLDNGACESTVLAIYARYCCY